MSEGVWTIPTAPVTPADVGQTGVGRLEKSGAFWPVIASLVAVFGVALCTMMLMGNAGLDQLGLYVLVGLAILLPYLVWTRVLLRFDYWTPRPSGLVFLAILWGCLPSVVGSVIMETEFDGVAAAVGNPSLGLMVAAPFSEELTKGLFVVLLFIFGRRHLRGPWDGMVFGAMAGAGFGFAEDIGYLVSAFDSDGMTGLILNYILREVFTAHAHLVFTAATGLAAGLAARHGPSTGRDLAWIALGFLGAFALHAAWDTSSAIVPSGNVAAMLLAPLVQGAVLAIIAFVGLRFLRRREDRILAQRLGEYVDAGWLSADETAWIADPHGRAFRALPTPRRRTAWAFLAAQMLLALNREKAVRSGGTEDTEREDLRLRDLLASTRTSSAE